MSKTKTYLHVFETFAVPEGATVSVVDIVRSQRVGPEPLTRRAIAGYRFKEGAGVTLARRTHNVNDDGGVH
jgi:hypothetical protein